MHDIYIWYILYTIPYILCIYTSIAYGAGEALNNFNPLHAHFVLALLYSMWLHTT